MVSDSVVGPIIRSNFITYVSTRYLRHFLSLQFSVLNCLVVGKYSLCQNLETSCFISMLISLVLTLCLNSCRVVNHPDSRVCSIDMLTSSTRCSLSLYSYIIHIHLEISRDLGHGHHNTSGGMQTTHFFSSWNSLDFVNSRLMFKVFECILSIDMIKSIFTSLLNCHVLLKIFFLH